MNDEVSRFGFTPFDGLAETLLPQAVEAGDGAHDVAHLLRVFHNAMRIQAEEGGDAEVIAAAVLLHDCVSLPKNHPDRAISSRLAAEKAAGILSGLGWEKDRVEAVAHAILTHSFSAGLTPETREAKILQDADRLDSLGAMGIARTFYTAARMGSKLYHPGDPQAASRDLDDRAYAIDHFETKLLKLAEGFQTGAGRRLAGERHRRLVAFRDMFFDEL
ncbi:HD domain-containing protein [Rhizobium sp. SSA_523]|uniref:HD domain-containing protein n=1 Tax=Rhizobium sp. SSA_523 TaxID=2952477 RepID=UPI0020900C7B|nr:HD domain-containing protein [Rhizobium sp. SSA_523]MCO5730823.1 HD domain-containing protein [Rhizobium sp. SSA_523]WKC24355.1 HD domain-containing protein [Rhizobium sp. SSA_523]